MIHQNSNNYICNLTKVIEYLNKIKINYPAIFRSFDLGKMEKLLVEAKINSNRHHFPLF